MQQLVDIKALCHHVIHQDEDADSAGLFSFSAVSCHSAPSMCIYTLVCVIVRNWVEKMTHLSSLFCVTGSLMKVYKIAIHSIFIERLHSP